MIPFIPKKGRSPSGKPPRYAFSPGNSLVRVYRAVLFCSAWNQQHRNPAQAGHVLTDAPSLHESRCIHRRRGNIRYFSSSSLTKSIKFYIIPLHIMIHSPPVLHSPGGEISDRICSPQTRLFDEYHISFHAPGGGGARLRSRREGLQ